MPQENQPNRSSAVSTDHVPDAILAAYARDLFDDCPADWCWLESIGWKPSTYNGFYLVPPGNDTRLGFSKTGSLELEDNREKDCSDSFRIDNPTRGQVRILLALLESIK